MREQDNEMMRWERIIQGGGGGDKGGSPQRGGHRQAGRLCPFREQGSLAPARPAEGGAREKFLSVFL